MTLVLIHTVAMLVFFTEIIKRAAFPGGRLSTLLLLVFLLLITSASVSEVTGRKSKFVWIEIFLY
jgi:hypothetical protein